MATLTINRKDINSSRITIYDKEKSNERKGRNCLSSWTKEEQSERNASWGKSDRQREIWRCRLKMRTLINKKEEEEERKYDIIGFARKEELLFGIFIPKAWELHLKSEDLHHSLLNWGQLINVLFESFMPVGLKGSVWPILAFENKHRCNSGQ